jgi:hypothetical protein
LTYNPRMGKRTKIVITISLIYVLAIFISLNGGDIVNIFSDIVNIFMCGVHIFGLFFVIFLVGAAPFGFLLLVFKDDKPDFKPWMFVASGIIILTILYWLTAEDFHFNRFFSYCF